MAPSPYRLGLCALVQIACDPSAVEGLGPSLGLPDDWRLQLCLFLMRESKARLALLFVREASNCLGAGA